MEGSSSVEHFPEIKKIEYEGPKSKNPLAFRFYNPEQVVMGKTMKEWLRFSVCYWHTWRGGGMDMFGPATMKRSWDDGSNSLETALRIVDVHFEFLEKLGVEYFCFHDRDIAPEGKTLEETNKNLDVVVAKIKQKLQESNGKFKVLWGTANLFSAVRYMNGAATNPDAHVFAYAAAQVKKALEISKELGAECYVFWGGREGYFTLLNTDMRKDLDHYARFLQMAVDYKKEIGFTGQFLIEPKPREPTKHQYDYDCAAVMAFLKQYGLEREFKLNIEANHCTLAGHTFEHELQYASAYGLLGSVDANTGDPLLGWDTDQFNTDIKSCTLAMEVILRQNGLNPGGLNFDCKLRRESTDLEDLFIGHISGMDTFARGLLAAAAIIEEGTLPALRRERYASWEEEGGIGRKIEDGTTDFKELEAWVLKAGEPKQVSGKQEKYEVLLNTYI
ncbi:Xylose isomerase [Balamuthia mandrillaris]